MLLKGAHPMTQDWAVEFGRMCQLRRHLSHRASIEMGVAG
jgi:hypothetical protein